MGSGKTPTLAAVAEEARAEGSEKVKGISLDGVKMRSALPHAENQHTQ
jgi:hypothetical protein